MARQLLRRRVLAAWVSGPLAVGFGAVAHLLSGEAVPGPWILLAMAALLSMAASMLARARVPVWVLFVVSGVVQQVLHVAFSGLYDGAGGTSSGHMHRLPAQPLPQPVQTSNGHHSMELMLDTHVAAALLTVLVITQSEVLIARLFRRRRVHPLPQPPGP